MSTGSPSADDKTPAERRLGEHLDLLRTDPPPSTALSVDAIVRRARWQRAIRRPLLTIGALTASVLEGIRLFFGPRAGHR
jgi:hypothetical protein